MGEGGAVFEGSVPEGYARYLEPVIFRPWAERLLDLVGVTPGQTVLDVACGTGVVSRLAAVRAGAAGRVIATDISAAMLDQVRSAESTGADIEIVQCPATDLGVPDDSVDAVLCQQGFPFIPDRLAAAREMHRVLRTGGTVGIAVWLASPRVEPFIVYGEVLRDHGVPEPFPHAYSSSAMSMSAEDMTTALVGAGFRDVGVHVQDMEIVWPSADHAARGAVGTPYGPVIAGLEAKTREAVLTDLLARMTADDGSARRHAMTSVLARGTAS